MWIIRNLLRLAQSVSQSVQGSNPCLSVCALHFGFVSQALAGLYRDVFVAKFLPLVAVVDAGTTQQTRQIVLHLGVVLNQLRYGIKLCLAFLLWQKKKLKMIIEVFCKAKVSENSLSLFFLCQQATKKRKRTFTSSRNFPLRVFSTRCVTNPEGKRTIREPHLGFLGCGHRRYDPSTSSASRE